MLNSGTNLQALIDAQGSNSLPNCKIIRVISNRRDAYGLKRAEAATIPTSYLGLQPFLKSHSRATRDNYDEEVARLILQDEPDLVVLAGWMHILSQRFLDLLHGAISAPASDGREELRAHRPIPVINLHPALPGAFDGVNAIQRAWEAFQKKEIEKAGVMVHRVIKEVDKGEPLLVREIRLTEGESLEEFEARVHKEEWAVIVEGTAMALERLKQWTAEETGITEEQNICGLAPLSKSYRIKC